MTSDINVTTLKKLSDDGAAHILPRPAEGEGARYYLSDRGNLFRVQNEEVQKWWSEAGETDWVRQPNMPLSNMKGMKPISPAEAARLTGSGEQAAEYECSNFEGYGIACILCGRRGEEHPVPLRPKPAPPAPPAPSDPGRTEQQQTPAPRFKVGDRVRVRDDKNRLNAGAIATVVELGDTHFRLKFDGNIGETNYWTEELEPAPPVAPPAKPSGEKCDCPNCGGMGVLGIDGTACACVRAGCKKRHGIDAIIESHNAEHTTRVMEKVEEKVPPAKTRGEEVAEKCIELADVDGWVRLRMPDGSHCVWIKVPNLEREEAAPRMRGWFAAHIDAAIAAAKGGI